MLLETSICSAILVVNWNLRNMFKMMAFTCSFLPRVHDFSAQMTPVWLRSALVLAFVIGLKWLGLKTKHNAVTIVGCFLCLYVASTVSVRPFYASLSVTVMAGNVLYFSYTICPSSFCERNVSEKAWGNFLKIDTNIHLDSRINCPVYANAICWEPINGIYSNWPEILKDVCVRLFHIHV